ncbi:MAG TPA: hypothetical protein VHD88_09430 [Pyrinomonadaceae bacterium]|nr:hypothetical protein [Pyrinomonadaceae bacterium]
MARISLLILFLVGGVCAQQQGAVTPTNPNPVSQQTLADPFEARLIPRNSRVYIAQFKSEDSEHPVEGFETYMAAALRKKKVPLVVVNDRTLADFEIVGSADKKGAGFAKKWILGDFRRSTSASFTMTNIHTGVVAYADASDRASANKGLRSSAEKLAKYLKRKIEDDEKKRKH